MQQPKRFTSLATQDYRILRLLRVRHIMTQFRLRFGVYDKPRKKGKELVHETAQEIGSSVITAYRN
jgi:hypothetical protein